jgi:diguanylate cyclase (GGDEF)-like protein
MPYVIPRTTRSLSITVVLLTLLVVMMNVAVFWSAVYERFLWEFRLATALCTLAIGFMLWSSRLKWRRLVKIADSSYRNEQRFLVASESSYDSFFILESVRDAEGTIVDFRFVFLNVNGAKLLSSTPMELQGALLCERYPVNRTDGFFERYKQVVETGQAFKAEFPIDAKDIHASWLSHQVVKLEDGVAITACDITDAKQKELLLVYLANHDSLTGLARRTLLDERLADALKRADGNGHFGGVLVVDCDHFKRVNDLLGHQVGDELLARVAARLQAGVRKCDTVARMGGDEFLLVLDDLGDEEQATTMAQELLLAIQAPMSISGHATKITASLGVCVYPRDGATASDLLKNADAAMYQAKADGHNRVQPFTRQMAFSLARRRELECGLEVALAQEEFALVYQPCVDLATGLVVGVEALLRWRSATLGLIMPGEFIPIAEANGLIVPIGRWVMETACREIRQLYPEGSRKLVVAVNVSPRQFQQETLVADIVETLKRNRLDASSLEIEITENLLLHESPNSRKTFDAVRDLGVAIAIDDFGTGYSSMSYLMRFRVERLKIDQSFVRRMTSDPDSDAICKAIVGLAKALNIAIVAEGVETAKHRDLLGALGCDEAQGNFYSEPVPLGKLAATIDGIESAAMQRVAA